MKKPGVLRNFRSLVRRLEAVSREPEAEARHLYHHLGLSLLDPWPAEQEDWLNQVIERRRRGEPLAYLLGTWPFLDLELEVTPEVLIPRPETETLALRALERARPLARPVILEVGTGSGAIALYLARHLPHAVVVATDLLTGALQVARRNAERLGLSLHWIQTDLLQGLATASVDLVVSNPPYVAEAEYPALTPEVHHEPRRALVAGPRGTEVQEQLLQQAQRVLKSDGWILLELAPHQARDLRARARTLGYRSVRIYPDMAGRPRVLEAQVP